MEILFLSLLKLIITLIKFYQKFTGLILKKSCRFQINCSQYAIKSFKKFKIIKGFFFTVKRILKCHPIKFKKINFLKKFLKRLK